MWKDSSPSFFGSCAGPRKFPQSRIGDPLCLDHGDQNAWVALPRAAWDKSEYPSEHATLTTLVEAIKRHTLTVPLTFTNLYETIKINDPVRRANIAHPQAVIRNRRVFRGRRPQNGELNGERLV